MVIRTLFILFVALTLIATAEAQITITQNSVMPTGMQWTSYSMLNLVDVDVGAAGANQTWTFGEFTFDYQGVGTIVDAGTTPYAESFPTANCAVEGDDGGSYTYYRNAVDAFYWLGLASNDVATVFETEACMLPFPCTYESAWTMLCYYEMELEPGMMIEITDSILTTVDGWGTCETPYGNEEVLRMFGQTFIRSELNGEPMGESEFIGYTWRTAGGLDYVIVTSDEGVTDPNFTSGIVEMVGDIQSAPPPRGPIAESFRVTQNYPNPFNPSTALPIELAKPARVTLKIYDETGRLVTQETHELSAGPHTLAVNGSGWPTGTYFANVSAGADHQTVKMLLVK